jgi:hypothetical protein
MNQEEREAFADFFVARRDANLRENEAIDQLINVLGKPIVEAENELAVSEENFNLNYSEFTGQKLGTFEVAEKQENNPEKWNRGFNILKNANASISSRYHGENYAFSYWIYNSQIYRQKLKK